MRNILVTITLLLATLSLESYGQTPAMRVATYNVLNFSGTPGTTAWDRLADLRIVVEQIRPDLLLVQEMINETGVLLFRDSALRSLPLMRLAPGADLAGTDLALYYNSELFDFIELRVIDAELRDITEHILAIRGTTDTLHVYNAHLKAGNSNDDAQQRAREAQLMRLAASVVPPNRHYLFAGDLNVYTSSEPAYQTLTARGGLAGEFLDPINRPGDWHSNEAYTDIHTQSPRVRQFGGGVHGGLDDRFDFVLISPSLESRIVPGSYTTVGNDGLHFDDSINRSPNLAVRMEVANALHYGSDHLPVYVDLYVRPIFSTVEPLDVSRAPSVNASPIPAGDLLAIRGLEARAARRNVHVMDQRGVIVAEAEIDAHATECTLNLHGLASGIYAVRIQGEERVLLVVPVVR